MWLTKIIANRSGLGRASSCRIAASYVTCYAMCGAMCHLAGPTYKEAWDPSYRFYKSYKSIAVLGLIWTLSLVVCPAIS